VIWSGFALAEPAPAYVLATLHQLELSGAAGYLHAHSHPFSDRASFSGTDDRYLPARSRRCAAIPRRAGRSARRASVDSTPPGTALGMDALVRYLTGFGPAATHLRFDSFAGRLEAIPFTKRSDCPVCGDEGIEGLGEDEAVPLPLPVAREDATLTAPVAD
jgi:hypothetical protein